MVVWEELVEGDSMGVFTVKPGDLFSEDVPAIGHGVNTKGAMASGIAVPVRQRFPRMHEEYVELCQAGLFRPGTVWVAFERGQYVFNIASQEFPGANARLDYLEDAFVDALVEAERLGVEKIALPQIGCGVGGLDWSDVEKVLRSHTERFEVDVDVVLLPATYESLYSSL